MTNTWAGSCSFGDVDNTPILCGRGMEHPFHGLQEKYI